MIYVFPYCPKHESRIKKIKGISRLFAYPRVPHYDNGGMVILDSGAFGLAQRGQQMTKKYMCELSKHYEQYAIGETICVAPDVYLNPAQSMWNIKKWFEMELYPNVAAVLQCEREHHLDIDNLKAQVDYYRRYTDMIFFSNNGLSGRAAKALNIERLFEYVKSVGVKWIHILGAGWSLQDIRDWCGIGYFDSMDSIAYYTGTAAEFGSDDPVESIESILAVCR